MSSDEDYSDDDFEEDFDDLTKTGVLATASAVEESTDDVLDGSVNCGLTDSCCELKTPEKDYQSTKVKFDEDVISKDTTKASPMSRQKRWSEICKASNGC